MRLNYDSAIAKFRYAKYTQGIGVFTDTIMLPPLQLHHFTTMAAAW